MFIFACTSWMIPESVETNKKQFSKEKKKSTRLKAQEGNLGKKRKEENKRKNYSCWSHWALSQS